TPFSLATASTTSKSSLLIAATPQMPMFFAFIREREIKRAAIHGCTLQKNGPSSSFRSWQDEDGRVWVGGRVQAPPNRAPHARIPPRHDRTARSCARPPA